MPEKKKLFFENIKEDQLELIINRLKNFIDRENVRFFYFSGVIGVGKTSFIRMMLRTLGVTENIKSPSFSMVETYEVDDKSFFHIDLFRMQDPNSWKTDEISAAFDDSTNYVFIEWPEKGNDLPAPDIKINIRHNKQFHDANVRDIAIEINTISTLRNNIK